MPGGICRPLRDLAKRRQIRIRDPLRTWILLEQIEDRAGIKIGDRDSLRRKLLVFSQKVDSVSVPRGVNADTNVPERFRIHRLSGRNGIAFSPFGSCVVWFYGVWFYGGGHSLLSP